MEQAVCEQITNLFENEPYWDSWVAYNTLTTQTNLVNTMVWRGGNDVWATDFWVGDFFMDNITGYSVELVWVYGWIPWINDYGWYQKEQWSYDPSLQTYHYFFYCHNGDNAVDKRLAEENTGGSKNYFSFICTCSSANLMADLNNNLCYGYADSENYTGVVGWAYAWVGRTDLTQSAYSQSDNSNYCYLAFQGASMPLKYTAEGTSYDYGDWVSEFYNYLIGGVTHHTVRQSLNYASWAIWGGGTTYANTPLYASYTIPVPPYGNQTGWMNLFGNLEIYRGK